MNRENIEHLHYKPCIGYKSFSFMMSHQICWGRSKYFTSTTTKCKARLTAKKVKDFSNTTNERAAERVGIDDRVIQFSRRSRQLKRARWRR